MKILSIHTGHDAAAAIYENYQLINIYKEERLSRVKCDGMKMPQLAINRLRKSHDFNQIDVLVLSKNIFDSKYYKDINIIKKIKYHFKPKKIELFSRLAKYLSKRKDVSPYDLIDTDLLKKDLGLRKEAEVYFANHHLSHALPTLFYNENWNDALLYTADGGGDFDYYSIYRFKNNYIEPLYEDRFKKDKQINSLGFMYSCVTKILGFKPNRHEGKITGLAAYGKESIILKDFLQMYSTDENGSIHVNKNFQKKSDIYDFLTSLSKKVSQEDFAFAAQYVLEHYILESIKKLYQKHRFEQIGLSGGVFANVKLNQKISELPFIKEMFVFPPMGDEGLVIGAVFEYLIQKNGLEDFLKHRKRIMEIPYWGDHYVVKEADIPKQYNIYAKENIPREAAKLLSEKKVCAIFTKAMEYGPRALGARSILIDPSDRSINDTVNKRLNRTEFMPFAPYVRIENLENVFDFSKSSKVAMRYMTVTCNVKEEWKKKIQATVHVDGTARPQSIEREDNPLYYDILLEFEKMTGTPCLVNTSFNAHEEPIINTFEEALQALNDDRVDYLITDHFIIGK